MGTGRAEGRVAGAKAAVAARLRRVAGVDDLADRAEALAAQVERLEAALARQRAANDRYDGAVAHQGELERHLHEIRDDVATAHRHLQVRAVTDWIAGASLRTSPLVSIVLPMRNRAGLLPRAVSTVLEQSYPNWELLIVDDASTDETASVLAALDDPRIRTFAGEGRGVCAARNVALREVRGSLVAYLDDDNRMHPDWLRSVVWAFEQRPETEVLYGAFVIDDLRRAQRRGEGDLPRLVLARYERAALERHNLTDIGAIAHRAGLPEGRFDEDLREMGDWDLFLRLTRDTIPLTLPAVACYYESHATDRLSAGPTHEVDGDRIRGKLR
jgi:hypothetical protein